MKKIMIVDDSKVVGLATKNSLEEIDPNYSVLYVDRGKKCLDLLEYNSFDLILLDIEMPEMNGWQVFKSIRENKKLKDMPIVFLTGREDDCSRAFGKIIANAYIEKGIGIKALKEKIESIFENPIHIDETKEKIIFDALQKLIKN